MSVPDCPVCGGHSDVVLNLPAAVIRTRLLHDLAVELPDDLAVADYRMLLCQGCTLEFADPMEPATGDFYASLAEKDWYYPADRWEWGEALSIIDRKQFGGVLEVGTGSGNFLRRLADAKSPVRAIGIDTSPVAIEAGRANGLEIYMCSLADLGSVADLAKGSLDCAVAFHCLEHVPDPVQFIRELALWVRPGGSLLHSVPYSPMTYEGLWRDPLNDPPHHLTRWNARSLAALGEAVDMDSVLKSPSAGLAVGRAARAVARSGPAIGGRSSKANVIALSLAHAWSVARETVRQAGRDRINGRVASDVVLLKLTKA